MVLEGETSRILRLLLREMSPVALTHVKFFFFGQFSWKEGCCVIGCCNWHLLTSANVVSRDGLSTQCM